MTVWKMGIVGTGLIADFHARAINELPNAKLIGCTDMVRPKAKSFAKNYSCHVFQDVAEMVASPDIDIITICTPSGVHADAAIAAAEAGKHVLCEKPLDVSLERIDSMIAAHEKAGTQLGGIFPYRFNDSMLALREAINDGRFGTITYAGIYIPWWRTDEYYKDSWHGTWNLDGGGAIMNQSIHMVDMLCDMMPPIQSIQAFTAKIGHPQIEAEDTATATLRYSNGALGVIYGTSASFPGQFRRFEISGTKGTVIQVEDSFSVWQFSEEISKDAIIREKFGSIQGGGGVADPASITHENHRRNFSAFLNALDEGRKFKIDGREARRAVEVILAIYESAEKQKCVNLI